MGLNTKLISGFTCGCWTVIEQKTTINGTRRYLCKCQCGYIKEISASMIYANRKTCSKCSRLAKYGDLTNNTYGDWKVLSHDKESGKWLCECKCGFKKLCSRHSLTSGDTTQCKKCLFYRNRIQPKYGDKFGDFTVIGTIKNCNNNIAGYKCRCKCGKISKRSFTNLYSKTNIRGCKFCRTKNVGDISYRYYCNLKAAAKKTNKIFDITIEDIWNQFLSQNRRCRFSGLHLVFSPNYYKGNVEQTASVDRIDSNKGYTKDNIQIVHKNINSMKSNYTDEYFIDMCKLIATNHSIYSI